MRETQRTNESQQTEAERESSRFVTKPELVMVARQPSSSRFALWRY